MRIPAPTRPRENSTRPFRAAWTPRRRDVASDLLAVVSSGTSLLRAATGVLRSGVMTIAGDARRPRTDPQRDAPCCAGETADDAATLIYEMLDAHYDTAVLAEELTDEDPDWEVHLDYLRALQRKGREMLARMPANGNMRSRATRSRESR